MFLSIFYAINQIYHNQWKQEMSLKKTNGVGLNKKKVFVHNLTQMTENLNDYCQGSADSYFGELC